jgi:hypothetical protein
MTEQQLLHKRFYMRRRRRDPENRRREDLARRRDYYGRKVRRALAANPHDRTSCHFCQFRACTTVDRLVPLLGELVPMQVPYCGQC